MGENEMRGAEKVRKMIAIREGKMKGGRIGSEVK